MVKNQNRKNMVLRIVFSYLTVSCSRHTIADTQTRRTRLTGGSGNVIMQNGLLQQASSRTWGERGGGRPAYLRQANRMIPCACQTCYFCLAKITTGVAHRQGARQRDHDAALNAIPHKWTAVSGHKCGWCLDKRGAEYPEEAASVSRGAVSNSSKVTCLKCDPAGRPLCRKCRNSAAAEHDH